MFSSTHKNLNLLTMLLIMTTVVGGYFVDSFEYIIGSIVIFYILNILGLYLIYHRFYAHRSFVFKYQWLEYLFLVLGILSGRGSPLAWVYIHRLHHRHSDTVQDPHQSKKMQSGFRSFFVFPKQDDFKFFVVKDMMTPLHLNLHHYYILYILLFALGLATVDFTIFYFFWLVPVVMIHLAQQNFNYWAHKTGYRNFSSRDQSKNNQWLFSILLGECWHNNHHHNPKSYTTQFKNYEIDPLGWFIKFIKLKSE